MGQATPLRSRRRKTKPVFYLLAGPNGAGKSTLYRALVFDKIISADLTFVNADLFERDHLQHITDPGQRSQAARDWADAQRAAKLAHEWCCDGLISVSALMRALLVMRKVLFE